MTTPQKKTDRRELYDTIKELADKQDGSEDTDEFVFFHAMLSAMWQGCISEAEAKIMLSWIDHHTDGTPYTYAHAVRTPV